MHVTDPRASRTTVTMLVSPALPKTPCHACKGLKFWMPPARTHWICSTCHPARDQRRVEATAEVAVEHDAETNEQ